MLNYYTEHYAKLKIPVGDLKPRCNLSDGGYGTAESRSRLMRNLGALRAEGVTADQARLIKNYFLARQAQEIEIMHTIPFAMDHRRGTCNHCPQRKSDSTDCKPFLMFSLKMIFPRKSGHNEELVLVHC